MSDGKERKTTYDRRKEAGACVKCGKVSSLPERVFCQRCLDSHRRTVRTARERTLRVTKTPHQLYWMRRKRGQCTFCGVNKAVDGAALCRSHLQSRPGAAVPPPRPRRGRIITPRRRRRSAKRRKR